MMKPTSHFSGHAHYEDAQAKAPQITLQSGINGSPDGRRSHIVMLEDGMSAEQPQDTHWDEREPKQLETL